MAGGSNGFANEASSVIVLYKVVNSKSDAEGLYNAFYMPRGDAVTLKKVKQNCSALHSLNPAGPEGYHWRVCIEDNRGGNSSSSKAVPFSWWDIQDENARLPVKEATPTELDHMFFPKSHASSGSSAEHATKAAKGGLKMLGKAVNAVVDAGTGGGVDNSSPRVGVIAFKLLDMIKMHDEFDHKHGGAPHAPRTKTPRAPKARSAASHRPAPTPARPAAGQTPAARRTTAPPTTGQRPAAAPRAAGRTPAASQPPRRATGPPSRPAEASLMNFDSPAVPAGRKTGYSKSSSLPSNFAGNETRAQRLKREYAQNQQKQNRVWDDVDQRWVDTTAVGGSTGTSASASLGVSGAASDKKVKGIKLDASTAAGKSANVQAAVNKRVNDMKESQAKALAEVRDRESQKKKEEAEEDVVRKRLEPKIKAWSEEHGKKKQLRALLASLHTILWPEANWKQVSLGDILDESKCKRCFHKASRVVHPDKTHHLDAEKRFLAKRIFDALSQAKTEFDDGA